MPSHYPGTAAEQRALTTYIKLRRCHAAVEGRLDAALAADDLTEKQLGVLETLLHLGPLHQHELGDKQFTSRGNITLVIDNLERRGLVRGQRDSADRRRIRVELTSAGRRFIEQVFPPHVARIVAEMARLTAREQRVLGALLAKLGRARPAP